MIQLAPSSLAEWYLPFGRAHEARETFPLDLHLCDDCGHVQLVDVIDPNKLFSNYAYRSESSPGLAEYFCRYASHVSSTIGLLKGSRVLDVGSNDGTLLRHFRQLGMSVIGVDPATEIARRATAENIPTINSFFNKTIAEQIKIEYGPIDLCTANNVFAHNDELGGMASAVEHVLADDGVFVFEVSYLRDTIENLVFDFIYHEHLCYHSVRPMRSFLRRHGLELFHVERTPSKGGTLRGFAKKASDKREILPSVDAFIKNEQALRLSDPETYRLFMERVNALGDRLRSFLQIEKSQSRPVWGYGASATVTTLLFHFGIGRLIDKLVDDNPFRVGTVSPGFGIPVQAPMDIYREAPPTIVILAWRFADAIVNKHQEFINNGGRFIVPLPEFRVIDSHGM